MRYPVHIYMYLRRVQFTLSITALLVCKKKAVIERGRYRKFADHKHVIN